MSNERETRYAAALWNAQAEWWRDGTLPEDFADFARAVMAVADEERAAHRAQVFADVAALMNDRAAMWWASDHPGRGPKASECQNLANAFRTYAEGVGVPSMDTLRRKRREAEEEIERLRVGGSMERANGLLARAEAAEAEVAHWEHHAWEAGEGSAPRRDHQPTP